MKLRFLGLTGLVALSLLAAACEDDGGGAESEGRLAVVATIAPAEALVREVAGNMAEIDVIAGTGVDPHDFELAPADRRALDDADLVVHIGLGIDPFADSVDEDRLLTLSDGLDLREGSEGDPDPHVWHSPENDRLMTDAIAKRLAELDPEHSGAYFDNAATFIARLDEADAEIRGLLDAIPADRRKIVTNHDSIGYFIDYYGLEFVGAVIPAQTTAAEPSASEIADLIELIEETGVPAVFAESTVDPAVAKQVAEETGVTFVDDLYADSLGPPGSGADTIDGMLLTNARKIAGALK